MKCNVGATKVLNVGIENNFANTGSGRRDHIFFFFKYKLKLTIIYVNQRCEAAKVNGLASYVVREWSPKVQPGSTAR